LTQRDRDVAADGLPGVTTKDSATHKLGRAVAPAHQSGNDSVLGLLTNVVDVVDDGTGTVEVKKTVTPEAAMTLDTRSVVAKLLKKRQGAVGTG
jgi:hypothetical protein